MLAHISLVITLLTGLLMVEQWLSWWLLSIIVIWILIGALMGLTTKYLRLSYQAQLKNEPFGEVRKRLSRYSLWLSVAIITMFVLKLLRYV